MKAAPTLKEMHRVTSNESSPNPSVVKKQTNTNTSSMCSFFPALPPVENTYDHVLQGTFGKPAVKKHRDEYVSQWRPEDLKGRRKKEREENISEMFICKHSCDGEGT